MVIVVGFCLTSSVSLVPAQKDPKVPIAVLDKTVSPRNKDTSERIKKLKELAAANEERFRIAFSKSGVDQQQMQAEFTSALAAAGKATSPDAAEKILKEFGEKRNAIFEKMISQFDRKSLGSQLLVCRPGNPNTPENKIIDIGSIIAATCPPTPTPDPPDDPPPTHSGVYDEFDIRGPFPVVRAYHQWEHVGPGSDSVVEDPSADLANGNFWIETGSVNSAASLTRTQVIVMPVILAEPARRIEITPVYGTGEANPLRISHHSVTIPPGVSTVGIHISVGLVDGAREPNFIGSYSGGQEADLYNFGALIGDYTQTATGTAYPRTLLLSTEGWDWSRRSRLNISIKFELTATAVGFATMNAMARLHVDHFHVIAIR